MAMKNPPFLGKLLYHLDGLSIAGFAQTVNPI